MDYLHMCRLMYSQTFLFFQQKGILNCILKHFQSFKYFFLSKAGLSKLTPN